MLLLCVLAYTTGLRQLIEDKEGHKLVCSFARIVFICF